MARIELDNVSLTFHVRQHKAVTLKEFLVKRLFRKSVNPVIEVKALQDVSLSVTQGERVGIIGHNGAGKSTLLKMLAGIYPPTAGTRIVDGKICSLFDIALGFETEATGWENIGYRCYLHGETPRSVRHKMQAIADFSELGRFLDMPVRFYSAGMMVRLAFSIATSIEPEVLLVDEVLAAGDLAFREKAAARMKELMARAHCVVLVSHDLTSMEELCDRVLWMDHGQVLYSGDPSVAICKYRNHVSKPQAA